MRESQAERALTRAVRERGGISVRLAPTQAGLPDRLILLPDRPALLVELKTDTGRLRPVQTVWHARAAGIGHVVHVVRPSTLSEFLATLDAELDTPNSHEVG